MNVATVVLAAGGSSRLGQSKQLLHFRSETLVRRAVRAASEAGCFPLVVVVGRDQTKIATELAGLPVILVPNENWELGLGTSIRAGITVLPKVDAVILLVCDQPHLDAGILRRLIEAHERTQQPIVASAYAGTLGVPSLFAASCFGDLCSLGDAEGAKAIITSRPNETAAIDFPEGAIDIDTPDDYRNLPNEKPTQPSP